MRHPEYKKVYDRHRKLFGIKAEGSHEWYVEPMFDEIEELRLTRGQHGVWFKKEGRYGLYDITEKRIAIPAEYNFPLYFGSDGLAITWKDHKAGVINLQGKTLIPFIYDEIHCRNQYVPIPEEERRTVTTDAGTVLHVGPSFRTIFLGYACFTNEGASQAYDEKCHPSEFEEWEKERLDNKAEYDNKEAEQMSIAELENLIRKEYIKLLELGYRPGKLYTLNREHRDTIDAQEEKVRSLLTDRCTKMNLSWQHNVENARRIARTNNLLMRAVSKAIKLGKKTARSLQWMEKVSHNEDFEVSASVYPYWQDSKSDLRYERKHKSAKREKERLEEEEDELAHTHIWNIIAAMGRGCTYQDDIAVCFNASSYEYRSRDWNERELTGDDGQTWDECIHFPAYQDVYFLRPFHDFYLHVYSYSFEDICNINDFRIHIDVQLVSKEQK